MIIPVELGERLVRRLQSKENIRRSADEADREDETRAGRSAVVQIKARWQAANLEQVGSLGRGKPSLTSVKR
jgi:hypothetical protein